MNEKKQDITREEVGVSPEKPEETGVISGESALDLRSIRKSQGLTLKDMCSSTRISHRNLKAIEEQRFELLPEPIYARAFIDTYARVLGVDGKKILSLYDTYLKSLEPDKDKYEVLQKLSAKRRHTGVWIWVIIISGLLVLAGSFYLYQWRTSTRQAAEGLSPAGKTENAGELQNVLEKTPEQEPGEVGIQGKNEPLKAGTPPPADRSATDSIQETDGAIKKDTRPAIEAQEPVAGGEQAKEAAGPDTIIPAEEKPYGLAIEASELTWIQISRDGNPPFEIMLRPGERITERASERFVLIIGNAGGVDIRFQGSSLGSLGGHGEVIHLTLPADR